MLQTERSTGNRFLPVASGEAPNGLELSCPAEAGKPPVILAHNGGLGAPPYGPARRVSFSELLGGWKIVIHRPESMTTRRMMLIARMMTQIASEVKAMPNEAVWPRV
jgi:hypothetical protein